jgi:predicted phosphoserine aminotransferase
VALTPLEPGHFFLPGPTEVGGPVLEAQARPVLPHRGAEIRALIERLQQGLRSLFRTRAPVLISTSSATGLMEAAVRHGVRDRVLCLVNGAFSERFAVIAQACGKHVERLEVEWGVAHEPDLVERRVAGGGYDAVTMVHSETSTGALNPVDALARAVRAGDERALVVVDSVTGVGGAPLFTDDWGLDFVLTGSQKALALPPGLAFGVASDAMLARAATVPERGFYFDLLRFRDEMARLQTPTTPAVTLLYALDTQLARMADETLEARWERHRAMAAHTLAWVERMREDRGVELRVLAPEGARSPTVTCLVLPAGVDAAAVVAGVRRRGWVLGGGYGKLAAHTIRVGHMGDHTVDELEGLLAALAAELLA